MWAGWERMGEILKKKKEKKKEKKKSAVIDYFAGKVSQITRPFNLKL